MNTTTASTDASAARTSARMRSRLVDIDSGATLKTNVMTNAINAGVSFHF